MSPYHRQKICNNFLSKILVRVGNKEGARVNFLRKIGPLQPNSQSLGLRQLCVSGISSEWPGTKP